MIDKEVKDWTFNELVKYATGHLILSIGTGDFNSCVNRMLQLTLQWKEETKKQEK